MKTFCISLIRPAGISAACLLAWLFISCARFETDIRFLSPVDGDMLSEYDGTVNDGSLETTIKILAAPGSRLSVNGIKASYSDSIFFAEVSLKKYENKIEVTEKRSGQKKEITIYWLKNYTNRYRLSLDDNIWFLKAISENADRYNSIFENPYLGFFKQVHDKYGTKIHFNIYYQTEGFNLSQMTTKFRDEWRQNAGWIRLSFHALQNDPDMPYLNAGYDQVKKDCEMVKEQIRRFAGDELIGPVTTLHWGEAKVEGCRALKDSGYTGLAGYFNVEEGSSPVSYYLDMEKRQNLNKRFIWRDNAEGIIFSRIAIVINNSDLNEIVPYLDEYKKGLHKPGFIDLMIHEQYFYPFYTAYQPDYREKVMTAVKWAADNGYKPAFLSECIYEK
jgi:hypothetical protein